MSESLWGAAMEWQAYLEEVTAGLSGNAGARAVREELRAHLEEARRRLMADEGFDAEQAAREAVRRLGSPHALGAALRARHSVDWHRVGFIGAAAGVLGATVCALGLHLLWQVASVMVYRHPLGALVVSAVWAAGVLTALVAALVLIGRGAGHRPVEFAVAVASSLAFTVVLAAVEQGIAASGWVHPAPPQYGPLASRWVLEISSLPPLRFLGWGWYFGALPLALVARLAEAYWYAALVLAGLAYVLRRIRHPESARVPVM